MAALSVNLATIFIIYLLVTFTKMGYMDNILDSNSFFAAFIFLNVQGKFIMFILLISIFLWFVRFVHWTSIFRHIHGFFYIHEFQYSSQVLPWAGELHQCEEGPEPGAAMCAHPGAGKPGGGAPPEQLGGPQLAQTAAALGSVCTGAWNECPRL